MFHLFSAAALLLTVSTIARAEQGTECRSCHADHFQAPVTHEPAKNGFCNACHAAEATHLSGADRKAVQTKPSPETCEKCHGKLPVMKHVHPALHAEGNCTQCHNPHGSNERKLIRKTSPELCTQCHEPGAYYGKVLHSPVMTYGKACLNCHRPHSSDQPRMLVKGEVELCLSCHNKPIEMPGENRPLADIAKSVNAGKQHAALEVSGCAACHRPHTSPYRRLLKYTFPVEIYAKYFPGSAQKPNTYALCFECHDVNMLERDQPLTTAFRKDTLENGRVSRRNLHWVHVTSLGATTSGKFGKSCKTCHDPHGAPQQHMIRDMVGVTSQAPMKYEASDQGGKCMISCHAEKFYQRLP